VPPLIVLKIAKAKGQGISIDAGVLYQETPAIVFDFEAD
jgi:hypothetical protein